MTSILVSGSSGFLGGKFVSFAAAKGLRVLRTAGRSSKNSLTRHDLIDVQASSVEELAEKIKSHEVSDVLHFATKFSRLLDPAVAMSLFESNLDFSVKLSEASQLAGCRRFINIGTSWEYARELNPENRGLLTPYAASKLAFRAYIDQRFGPKFAKTIILEESIDGDDDRDKIIPEIVRYSLAGKSFVVRDKHLKMNLANATGLAGFALSYLQMADPPSLVTYADYRGVEIHHVVSHLTNLGLDTKIEFSGESTSTRVSLEHIPAPTASGQDVASLDEVLAALVTYHRCRV